MNKTRILALSGSLRKASYNSALINAASYLTPADIEIIVFKEMANIPLFNPDSELENISAVTLLRQEISKADGLLISSPEYAHGISGVMKNTLDWLVSGEEFPYIPIALVNTSPRAGHAQMALREVLNTMSGNIIESASFSIPMLGTTLDSNALINDLQMSALIIEKLTIFRNEIKKSVKNTNLS